MPDDQSPARRDDDYAVRGDYHRVPNPDWNYYPTYVAKMRFVRRYLDRLPAGTRVLDAGCGEGVLIDEYRGKLTIEGVDLNYAGNRIQRASLRALPYAECTFDRVLCLDVLEHLEHADQPAALAEIHRVLSADGELLLSVPNLAHLQSRVHFLLAGNLIRTASEQRHPGDRPINEFLRLSRAAGFTVVERRGIFPTVPVLAHIIRRYPRVMMPLHDWLTRIIRVPGWCFINLVRLRKSRR